MEGGQGEAQEELSLLLPFPLVVFILLCYTRDLLRCVLQLDLIPDRGL